jgi:hypothetical protein
MDWVVILLGILISAISARRVHKARMERKPAWDWKSERLRVAIGLVLIAWGTRQAYTNANLQSFEILAVIFFLAFLSITLFFLIHLLRDWKRNQWQFTLKDLFIATILVALFMCYFVALRKLLT